MEAGGVARGLMVGAGEAQEGCVEWWCRVWNGRMDALVCGVDELMSDVCRFQIIVYTVPNHMGWTDALINECIYRSQI